MNRQSLIAAGGGLLLMAALVAASLYWNAGSHLELRTQLLQTQLVPIDEASAVTVLHLRCENPSDIPFQLREASVLIKTKDGKEATGQVASEVDTTRFYKSHPELGTRPGPAAITKTIIPAHQTRDLTLAASFPHSVADLKQRQSLTVRLLDVDGTTSEVIQ